MKPEVAKPKEIFYGFPPAILTHSTDSLNFSHSGLPSVPLIFLALLISTPLHRLVLVPESADPFLPTSMPSSCPFSL